MSQYNDTGVRTVTLTGTVEQHERVTHAGAQAGLNRAAGTARERGDSGDTIGVVMGSKQGTRKMIAAGVVAVGANLYGAAAGRVSTTHGVGAYLEGVAVTAAAAAGDVIEVECAVGEVVGT